MNAAIDSQTVTYLAEAIHGEYDPKTDGDPALREERIAVFRSMLYSDSLFVSETVREEINQISDPKKLADHQRLLDYLLSDIQVTDQSVVRRRADELQMFHSGKMDCLVVAEAELSIIPISTVVTYDVDFHKRLAGHCTVRLSYPTEHWKQLDIPRGSAPRWSPASTNPLSIQSWWRWD
jgi:hypothetical protein